MLLNLSNHPSAHWGSAQMEAATQQFGAISDWPFPAIDPHWDEDRVASLALEYADRVMALRPNAVHVMGELTFVFLFVTALRQLPNAPPCIASTAERRVAEPEPGKKIVLFQFVRFRKY